MAPSDDDGHEDRARPGDGDCLAGRAEYGPPPRRTVKTSSRGSSGPRRWHVHRNNSTLALRAGSHQPSCVIVVRGGIGSPGGRTAAPVRSVVKQPRRPTNCGGTDSPLVDELALCRRDCSPARGSPQPPQPTAANFSSTPERVFFHGANRSEATAVLSLRCRYRWSGQFWARGTR